MASASLLWLDVERARHSGVQSVFGEWLVKSGIIEPEFSTLYLYAEGAKSKNKITIWMPIRLTLWKPRKSWTTPNAL
jgi:uncharacterized protein (UPF0332 family)